MKKFCVMIMVCAILTACGDTSATSTTSEETDTVTVSDTISEAPVSEEISETQTERTEETYESETSPEKTEIFSESETSSERTEVFTKSETFTEKTEVFSESESFTERTEVFSESTETHDTSVENDEARDLWIKEMNAVDDAISELMDSDGFNDLKTTEKAEKMLALINGLAENGTKEYNYPLIKAETVYYNGDDMITFKYAGGGLGGVKLKPFDPMFN